MPKFDKVQDNPLVKVSKVQESTAHDEALRRSRKTEDPAFWEEQARQVARRFGVDEDLPPRERFMALARAIRRSGGIGGGSRRSSTDRIPGEDDE